VVTLALLAWIELFSGDMTSEGFSINVHILPFLVPTIIIFGDLDQILCEKLALFLKSNVLIVFCA
jgi:hypothetical protein